MLFFNIY